MEYSSSTSRKIHLLDGGDLFENTDNQHLHQIWSDSHLALATKTL